MTEKRCTDCKYTRGIGYDFWCGEGHTEYEVFGAETNCPYFEFHDWSKGTPSKTEKRFTIDYEEGTITDNKEYLFDLDDFRNKSAKEVVGCFNALHEENQKLDKIIEELDNCQKGQSHRINDLYLENKQLKDLIIHLGYTIKYDGYRHISLELRE